MNKQIKILPAHLANKIAAGEVIQRPASAVKELVENSLDAQARSIKVIVKDGGKEFIQVIDDGLGMSEENAAVAFHRHATSKIESVEDLENIKTLGFRGEALASIAAVSRVEMRTKVRGEAVGAVVRVDGSGEINLSKDACQDGTSVSMRNLFYNMPGRRNFLKNRATEYRHIHDMIGRCALSHPEVAFQFYSDDEMIMNLRASDLTGRLRDIFGDSAFDAMMKLDDSKEEITLRGYIGQPGFARRGRAEQYFFLNDRFIVSKNLSHAVYHAYEHLIEKGSFPFFILFIITDPKKVDVNVHPTKMEVKFSDESSLYRMIVGAVRTTLAKYDLIPVLNLQTAYAGRGAPQPGFHPGKGAEHYPPGPTFQISEPPLSYPVPSATELVQGKSEFKPLVPDTKAFAVYQLQKKYIIQHSAEGMIIIDQHAAHERILYEAIRSRISSGNKVSQQLLFPRTVQLPSGDASLIKELNVEFESLGFTLKYFGHDTVIIDGVPPEVKAGTEETILQDVLGLYKDDLSEVTLKPSERLAKTFACKAAVKAGDYLTEAEMTSLIDQLAAATIPNVCPHGRPVSIKLTLAELDRKFGRTS